MSDIPPSAFPPPSPVVGPTAGTPAPAPAATPKGPGKSGYLVGVAIILIGAVIGVVLLVVGFTSVVNAFTFPRTVGSDGSISIDRTGDYIVYEIGNDFEGTTSVIHPTVSVVAPDGTSVFAGDYTSSRNTTSHGRRATAIATFHADRTGRYLVTSQTLPAGEALGVGDGRKVRGAMIALGFAVGGLSFLVGVVVLIVTAARRHRAKPLPVMPMGYGAPGYGPPGYAPPVYGPPPGYGPPGSGPPGYAPPPGANPWVAPPAQPAPPQAPPVQPAPPAQPAPPQAPPPQEWWHQPPTQAAPPAAPQSPPPDPTNDPGQSGWASPS